MVAEQSDIDQYAMVGAGQEHINSLDKSIQIVTYHP